MNKIIKWLVKHQNKDGAWNCKIVWWRHKIPGLYIILNWYYEYIEKDHKILKSANRVLDYIISKKGVHELQLESHTQSISFTFLALTEKCRPGYIFPKPINQ
jgi:predicted nucleic acid binding AN1-type Zn finger protein